MVGEPVSASARLFEIVAESPTHPQAMAEGLLQQMAATGERFVPTLIANAPPVGQAVLGNVLMELTCNALATGQVLMVVGGYIVRGMTQTCRKRARAIRHENGAFDVVQL